MFFRGISETHYYSFKETVISILLTILLLAVAVLVVLLIINLEKFSDEYLFYINEGNVMYMSKIYEAYELRDKEGIISVTVDIKDLVKQMSEADKNNTTNATFEKVRYMKTSDENIMFYMTEFSMSYELYSNSLEHFSIEGYLLVK